MSIIRKLIRPPRRMVSITALMVCLFIGVPGLANDIAVSGVKRFGQVAGSHWMVRFHVSWMNSWRCDLAGAGQSAPYNYDAAWVFMKYRVGGTSDWQHAMLSTNASDHYSPAGSTIDVGRDGRAGEWGTNGVGVFIYRSANGSNTFVANSVRLRWNHAAAGVADNAQVELKVCAIEMVYVSTGAFYLGTTTGGSGYSRFYASGESDTTPFQITNENYEIEIITNVVGKLHYKPNIYGTAGDYVGILSNAFPKGYSAFYGMKYEITQVQYVDFLNTLTRNQQTNHFIHGAATMSVGDFMDGNNAQTFPTNRNGVQLISTNGTVPRIYANNLDMSNAPNSTNDGQWIACNRIRWPDFAAYLDWAGLRPMTELEFEKACRGTNYPVASEYAWATASMTQVTNIVNGGTANETPQPTNANCLSSSTLPDTGGGPVRVGSMGVGVGGRERVGAAYYGMMELSGNLRERVITVGRPEGRIFTGQHGNGILGSDGNADVSGWPVGTSENGACVRGGDYAYDTTCPRVADRIYGANANGGRDSVTGGRGVRTAP